VVMTLPDVIETEVFASLDGSGDFLGDDDRLLRVKADSGVTLDEGRDGAQQLNPPKVGAGACELSDEDGRYSPLNAASPYYQRLLPGKPVLYQAKHGTRRLYRSHIPYRSHVYYRGLGVWPLGRHVVDDLEQQAEIGNRRVRLSSLGWETLLTKATVTVALKITPLVSECFTALLDAVNWPTALRDVATSDTRLASWWCDERHPWDAMLELLASEGPGMFGVRRDGTFFFENRNYRAVAARATTSQATFYDRVAGQQTPYRAHLRYRSHRLYRGRVAGLVHANIRPLNPLRSIYNRATYTTRRRTTGALQQVYQYGASLTLAANQSMPLFVRPSDPFMNAVSPVAGTDYVVSSGSATVALTYSSGILAILTVTAGASGATIDGVTSSGLQLRAQPLTVVSETTVENSVDASDSIARYSPIPGRDVPLTYAVQGWPEIEPANAVGVCDAWVLRQQELRPLISFVIQGDDAAHLETVLRLRESDRVTVTDAHLNLSAAELWVNATQFKISGAGGRTVELTVLAEVCDTLTGAIWDRDLWDDPAAVWGI
jgi:hypothetical protein